MIRQSYNISLIRLFSAGLFFLSNIVLQHVLSAQKYGEFAVFLSTSLLLMGVSRFGADYYILKEYSDNTKLWKTTAFVNSTIISVLFSVILVSVIIFFTKNNYSTNSIFMLYAVPLSVILLNFGQLMIAKNQLVSGALFSSGFFRNLFFLLFILAIYISNTTNAATATIYSWILSPAISFLLVILFVHKILLTDKLSEKHIHRTHWIRSSIVFLPQSLAPLINKNIDTLAVGFLIGTEAAGLYFFSVKLAEITNFLITSTNTILGRNYIVSKKSNSSSSFEYKKSLLVLILSSLVIGLAIIIVSNIASHHLELFSVNLTVVGIAISSIIIRGLFGPVDLALAGNGMHKEAWLITATTLSIYPVMLFIFGIYLGIIGIAIASAINNIMYAALISRIIFKRKGEKVGFL